MNGDQLLVVASRSQRWATILFDGVAPRRVVVRPFAVPNHGLQVTQEQLARLDADYQAFRRRWFGGHQ